MPYRQKSVTIHPFLGFGRDSRHTIQKLQVHTTKNHKRPTLKANGMTGRLLHDGMDFLYR